VRGKQQQGCTRIHSEMGKAGAYKGRLIEAAKHWKATRSGSK
jgi:hypothetical protein